VTGSSGAAGVGLRETAAEDEFYGPRLTAFELGGGEVALKKEQRQDVALPVRSVNGAAAQGFCAIPEVGFELLEIHAD
jgi:hypothetical protein